MILSGGVRAVIAVLISLGACPAVARERECVQSPDRSIEVCVSVSDGRATYAASRRGIPVVAPSALGLLLDGAQAAHFDAIASVRRGSNDSTWEQPWGEQRLIRDNHREMVVTLRGADMLTREVDVVFRVFDDGFGFRYDYRSIPAGRAIAVTGEATGFSLPGELRAWWYPALQPDRDEYLYGETDARRITLAETPLTLRRSDGLHLSIHEAALVDFPSMLLQGDGAGTLAAWLMPWPDGVKARKNGPFMTPWRTVLIGENAGALADSRLTLNLNEPSRIADMSWFRPGKYVGVWWEMHLDRSTWASGPRHGANTDNVKRYIDFAAANGFGGVLAEGWNVGWDGDWTVEGDRFSFTQSMPDFDLAEISRYGRQRGVRLIGHHETGGAVENYERQLDDAMALYRQAGVNVVKTGYVRQSGTILDAEGGLQWFAGQYMVRHHQHVAEVAARHRIAVNAHEPVKDTGLRRTWPNMVSREGARGQEFNAWGRPTNPPEHMVIMPFTRLLAGPMDYTPGIFDIEHGKSRVEERVQSTLAAQLAMYVVVYSPVHMAPDLPENYLARPDAFQFVRDVPTDWEVSRTLAGTIGDMVVVARQQRGSRDWYLGALTDERGLTIDQALDFLPPGERFEAQIYMDAADADYRTAPTRLSVRRQIVEAHDRLSLTLAPGGGAAIRFRHLDRQAPRASRHRAPTVSTGARRPSARYSGCSPKRGACAKSVLVNGRSVNRKA